MLLNFAGWCGEILDVIFSGNGTVTVVYRLTVRGSDGEAYRESIGTVSTTDGSISDPVSAAEENAFCKVCVLGLVLACICIMMIKQPVCKHRYFVWFAVSSSYKLK